MSVGPAPLEVFRAKGIPNRRMEDWKYSDLRGVLDVETIEREGGAKAVISVPASVEQVSLKDGHAPQWLLQRMDTIRDAGAMDAAARARDPDGVAFRVASDAQIATPLRLDLQSDGHRQFVLVLERGASLTLVETHHVAGAGLRNVSFSVFLEEGAQLTHIREAKFSGDLIAVETISVVQEKGSVYRARFLNGGAKLSRTEVNITLAGEGAEADLSGVSVLGDKAHADITTRVVHAVPNTTSRQLFKKVAGGKSRVVYQGKVTVREGAIGADSRQTAKALLLSDRAEADLKPELEILADDVKCAHGAAVGDLDQESLFYLRSRGIPESEARGLLVHAFLQEVVDGIEDEGLRGTAVEFIESGLAWAMESAS
jgi:Fe-S cluster assembly protein SufD